MEPREYDMDRHKTKSDFKRQWSKVINRELWAAYAGNGPHCWTHGLILLPASALAKEGSGNLADGCLCQEGHSAHSLPLNLPPLKFIYNFCIFVFNAHLFKVAKEIVHEPFQSNKGQKYKGYKSKPTGRVSQRVTWYSGPHRNSSKQWSDTVVHTCNPSYSACRGRRIGWDWATKQNPIY